MITEVYYIQIWNFRNSSYHILKEADEIRINKGRKTTVQNIHKTGSTIFTQK